MKIPNKKQFISLCTSSLKITLAVFVIVSLFSSEISNVSAQAVALGQSVRIIAGTPTDLANTCVNFSGGGGSGVIC